MANKTRNVIQLISSTDIDYYSILAPILSKNNNNNFYFDFNKLIPILDSLNIVRSGNTNIETTLQEYSKRNWGTQCNSFDNEIDFFNGLISFSTIWSCPHPIIEAFTHKFPTLNFTWDYASNDTGSNTGRYTYENETLSLIEFDNFTNEAYETYIKCWGQSNCLYIDKNHNWRTYSCDTCTNCGKKLIENDSNKNITNLYALMQMKPMQRRDFILEALNQWSGSNSETGSYIYDLTRTKTAFSVGTITLDDFEEWSEERLAEVADEFSNWLQKEFKEL